LSLEIQSLVGQVRAGDTRALARVISAVENRLPGSSELLKVLFPYSGRSRVIGLDRRHRGQVKARSSTNSRSIYRKQNQEHRHHRRRPF
jgi:putative protein kinase ArgK-like GTPase of G3E family